MYKRHRQEGQLVLEEGVKGEVNRGVTLGGQGLTLPWGQKQAREEAEGTALCKVTARNKHQADQGSEEQSCD